MQEVMGGRRALVLSAASVTATAAMLIPAVGATAATKVVKVSDDVFTPTKVTVHKYGKVKWDWTPVFNNHNVTLKKGPDGVKKRDFRSQTSASSSYSFKRKFTKVGKYNFYCTIHPDVMTMDVVVKK